MSEAMDEFGLIMNMAIVLAVVGSGVALDHALSINPKLDVVARVHSDFELDFLRGRGASELVRPELEASIELVRHTMCRLGFSEDKVEEFIGNLRNTCPI